MDGSLRDTPTVLIGRSGADHIRIAVHGREHPEATDWADGNWLHCSIVFKLGAFNGDISASLRSEEFKHFLEALAGVNDALAGAAHLDSMETWIKLTIAVVSRGQLEIAGSLTDRPGLGNTLEFEISGLDQSDLAPLIKDLEAVLAAFPER